MFGFNKNKKEQDKEKISKNYILINTNQNILKKYFDNAKTVLYVSLLPYSQNTKINVFSEENELIGEIAEANIKEIINFDFQKAVGFISTSLNDSTGEMILSVKIMCTKEL